MSYKAIALSALLALSGVEYACAQGPAASTESCAAVKKEEISALFDRWNTSLQTKDPQKVVANYAPDAVLLPTVSNKPRTTPTEIADYFHHFLEKSPMGTINTRIIKLGCNTAIDTGTYTFNLTDTAGKKSDVAARYTFTYTYQNGQWLISSHHSSKMPES